MPPGPAPAGARPGPKRELRPAGPPGETKLVIAAPATSRQPQSDALPSVVIDPSLEAETETEEPSLKALRATRATVRISSAAALGIPLRASLAPASSAPVSSAPNISTRPLSPSSVRALALGAGSRLWLALGALVIVASLVWAFWPSKGTLLVTVSGPGGAAVEGVQVFVDGKAVCTGSPCNVPDLPKGAHLVRASAQGLGDTADESISIEAGSQVVHNIRLIAAAGGETGGIQVSAGEQPILLFVDGQPVGNLPQKVMGLAVGEHWLKFAPSDGTDPFEKSVVIGAAEILQVEPTPAHGDKVLVTIRLSGASEGATVTLNDDFLLDFPAELELTPGDVYELKATKSGYKDFSTQVHVNKGDPRKTIEIDLEPAAARMRGARNPTLAKDLKDKLDKLPAVKPPAAARASAAPAVAAGNAVLDINSSPPSSVILNGRPLGMTPQMGVEVPGGQTQTLIFVHPKYGRRKAEHNVPAGKKKTVSIRF
jgi:hypothetical protein